MRTKDQSALRMYVRAREDFQSMRKRMDNRLARKADGTSQKVSDPHVFSIEDVENFDEISKQANLQEKATEKMLKKVLKRFPVYNEWLKGIKGIGEVSAGWLLGEFDIEKAVTVSKMWQYAGLNPSLIPGKKRVSKKSYNPEMGQIVSEVKNIKSNEIDYIIQTNELIRGDKAMEGFLLPYNKNLKTFLLGVMATQGFIMQQNSYAVEFYYPYKNRLEHENSVIENKGKARKGDGQTWKTTNPGHRDNAAKRYMIKMFLRDFYMAWRTIEGLPVRIPYEEEYLGKRHEG